MTAFERFFTSKGACLSDKDWLDTFLNEMKAEDDRFKKAQEMTGLFAADHYFYNMAIVFPKNLFSYKGFLRDAEKLKLEVKAIQFRGTVLSDDTATTGEGIIVYLEGAEKDLNTAKERLHLHKVDKSPIAGLYSLEGVVYFQKKKEADTNG